MLDFAKQQAIEAYLGVGEGDRDAAGEAIQARDGAAQTADDVLASLGAADAPSDEQVAALRERIERRQSAVGFSDYASWMEKVGPPC